MSQRPPRPLTSTGRSDRRNEQHSEHIIGFLQALLGEPGQRASGTRLNDLLRRVRSEGALVGQLPQIMRGLAAEPDAIVVIVWRSAAMTEFTEVALTDFGARWVRTYVHRGQRSAQAAAPADTELPAGLLPGQIIMLVRDINRRLTSRPVRQEEVDQIIRLRLGRGRHTATGVEAVRTYLVNEGYITLTEAGSNKLTVTVLKPT